MVTDSETGPVEKWGSAISWGHDVHGKRGCECCIEKQSGWVGILLVVEHRQQACDSGPDRRCDTNYD